MFVHFAAACCVNYTSQCSLGGGLCTAVVFFMMYCFYYSNVRGCFCRDEKGIKRWLDGLMARLGTGEVRRERNLWCNLKPKLKTGTAFMKSWTLWPCVTSDGNVSFFGWYSLHCSFIGTARTLHAAWSFDTCENSWWRGQTISSYFPFFLCAALNFTISLYPLAFLNSLDTVLYSTHRYTL